MSHIHTLGNILHRSPLRHRRDFSAKCEHKVKEADSRDEKRFVHAQHDVCLCEGVAAMRCERICSDNRVENLFLYFLNIMLRSTKVG